MLPQPQIISWKKLYKKQKKKKNDKVYTIYLEMQIDVYDSYCIAQQVAAEYFGWA